MNCRTGLQILGSRVLILPLLPSYSRSGVPKYIFTEDEWLTWEDGYTTATLVAIEGSHYGQIKHRSMKSPPPGAPTYDRFLGVNTFGPGGVYESHIHESPMFYYVLTGTALMRVGDEERTVGKGA